MHAIRAAIAQRPIPAYIAIDFGLVVRSRAYRPSTDRVARRLRTYVAV